MSNIQKEFLSQYNVTDQDKIVKLKATKIKNGLTDQINIVLKPDGYYPMHVDILNNAFVKLGEPNNNRIYFIQDLDYTTIEDYPDNYSYQDAIINEAIDYLQTPVLRVYVEEYYANKRSQS